MFTITCVVSELSQCAPVPGRIEQWNPYHYPSVRSLSMPPPPPSPPTTKVKTISTSRRPRLRYAPVVWPADLKGKDAGKLKFDLGNVTAVSQALNEFIRAAEVLVRELLISTNTGLLKVIGQVDHGIERFQKRLQSSGLRLALAGQRAAAQTYESLPPFVNKLIQRLGTPADGRSREQLTSQLNDAVKNLRELKKMLTDALDDHEKDFHNVFQDRFAQANQYLGVPSLPRKPLAWYP